ncbi:alpha/beta fold hydrolase [Fodinicola feengrottensis]|uniref:alpha/beta fold hydrolase n=1 Tax=Fodinicola feengrottensis TaxID=435914 RepID=UPI0013D82B83|nr:alpha/beta hydrolase [Fodinicola feengrottensis]
MYYELHGEGRPLVLLHGGGVHTIDLTFGPMLPALAANRQVIAVEMQGHGHTADIDRDFTIESLAGDIVALLDQLGLDRADFFGFSVGGLTALRIAMLHPERVDRLVLASTQYQLAGYYPEIQHSELPNGHLRLPTPADFQEMREAYTAVSPTPDAFMTFLPRVSQAPNTIGEWTADDLRNVSSPTLMIIGDTDFVRLEHAAEMHEILADSRLAVLPNTTHMAVMRQPELVLPMVSAFLER